VSETDNTLKVIFPEEDDAAHAPAASDVTRRVSDDPPDVTRRVEVGGDGTMRVDWAPRRGDLPLGTLPPGSMLCGDCRVEQTLHPHESDRPGLYLCTAPEGAVVVKVYAANFPPKPELWERLAGLRHTHVLRIFRTLQIDRFYYEVQEFCAGGTLAERVPRPGSGIPPVAPEWVTGTFVPHMLAGLNYLHEQGIIHRDIKPANLYLRLVGDREELVLADFDISSVLDTMRTSRDTQRAGGTWLYTAPEAFPRFVDDHASARRGRISRSSDFYSLGITTIELLMGTTSLHLCQLADLFDFYLQGGRVEIPRNIPSRLALLLRGILIRNRRTRWGAEEVERWLRNGTSDADLQRIRDDEAYELARAGRPYRLGDLVAVDLPTLADAMYRNPEVATEDLMSGDMLINWIGTLDQNIARRVRRDRELWRSTPEVALWCAILHCDPTRPFIFNDGTEVETMQDWLRYAIRTVSHVPGAWESFPTDQLMLQLAQWLRLKADPEETLGDNVADLVYSPPRVRIEELAYLLQPERPYGVMRGVGLRTPHEIVAFTYGTAEEWTSHKRPTCYEASYQRWYEGGLCAWLRQRGMVDIARQADEIRAQLPDDPFAAFETILRLLEPGLPKVRVEIEPGSIPPETIIEHGHRRVLTLRYRAKSPGMPFGSFVLPGEATGVSLPDPLLRRREGTLQVAIDSTLDVQAFKDYVAEIGLESGITELTGTPKVRYQVVYPTEDLVIRCLIGAAAGGALLFLPRFLMTCFWKPGPYTVGDMIVAKLLADITALRYPAWPILLCFFVLAVAVYGGLYLWLWALKHSKV
jgi:hypothetical protein